MNNTNPRVSIGLPVYNGENYLESTLDALLAQTFTDFELIISDNASTDRTQEICLDYAARDRRIRYVRNATNIGAVKNYNQTVALARGTYFKWNGHDDPCAPTFLEQCVAALDRDPSVVLAYTKSRIIDEQGKDRAVHLLTAIENKRKRRISAPQAHQRFYDAVIHFPLVAIFGVMRLDVLKKTPLHGAYISADMVLLGELAILGRFYEVPAFLMYRRIHGEQPWMMTMDMRVWAAWYDPSKGKKWEIPHWRLFWEYLASIKRAAPNARVALWCYLVMVIWVMKTLTWTPMKTPLRSVYRQVRAYDKDRWLLRFLTRKVGV